MRTLRLAQPSDAAAMAAIYRPAVVESAISFELEPPGERELAARLEALRGFAPWLACEDDGLVTGYAYASRHRDRAAYQWSVDVSVYVLDGRRRGGVGRALYGSLLALLRLQGFKAAHAGIALPNPGSVGLHEALGFRRVGVYARVGFKLGAWHDVGWWQLELAPRLDGEPPPPPRAMADLLADPGFEAALASGAR